MSKLLSPPAIASAILTLSCLGATPALSFPSWPNPDPAASHPPYRIYNIGNNAPVDVREVLRLIEKISGE